MKKKLLLLVILLLIQIYCPKSLASAISFETESNQLRGINLGNALDAPSYEGEWGVTLRTDYFTKIKSAGFNLIRIPVRFYSHALTEYPFTIEEGFLERVDWALNESLSRNIKNLR